MPVKILDRAVGIETRLTLWYVREVTVDTLPWLYDRLILLNSAIAFPGYITYHHPISLDVAKEIVKEFASSGKIIESYIGHQSTASLLSRLLGIEVKVNRDMAEVDLDTIALVFRLRKRLPKPEEVSDISEDDIEVGLLTFGVEHLP